VHNRTKRLPPVAAAFKDFLLREGAPLIARLVRSGFSAWPGEPRVQAAPALAGGPRASRRRSLRPAG